MTVGELINKLQKYPTDMIVVSDGYEGGCDDLGTCRQALVVLNVWEQPGYFGPHEEVDGESHRDWLARRYPSHERKQVVYLSIREA